MRHNNRDLIVAVIIASSNILTAWLPARPIALGIILALPLVFFLPGYTLTEALFHRRKLTSSYHLVLSLSLSMVIDIIGGFILNLLPIGLQPGTWAGLLGLLTIALALLVAYLRRSWQAGEGQPGRLRMAVYQMLLFGLAALVAVFSILYAALGVIQQPHPGFTQLWMLPTVQAGKSCVLHLGIRSFEATSVTYRITLTTNGTQTTPSSLITLAPQQEWQQTVPVTPQSADQLSIVAQLYRLDKPQNVYRNVHVTLSNLPVGKDSTVRQCGVVQRG